MASLLRPLALSRRFRQRHPRVVRGVALHRRLLSRSSFAVGLVYASWALVCRAGRCPSVEVLEEYQPRQTSKLYAADGRFIAELGLERRTLVKIDQIPAARAQRVRRHRRQALLRARRHRLEARPERDCSPTSARRSWQQGFSTITMQLARNIFPERISREKCLVRKLKEAKVARAIEAQVPEEQHPRALPESDLSRQRRVRRRDAPRSATSAKSVKDLNLAEAATLAALPEGPGALQSAPLPRSRRFSDATPSSS